MVQETIQDGASGGHVAQGLNYYSDAAIGRHLNIEPLRLAAARAQLERADLIAYRQPLYQVLSLPEPSAPPPSEQRRGQSQSAGDILRRALGGGMT